MKRDSKENRMKLPSGFHGNHPAYSIWIDQQIQEAAIRDGRLTPDALNSIISNAKKEIQKAYNEYLTTGVNMNSYFKNRIK